MRVATVELMEGVAVRGREIRALVEENQEVQYILKPLPSKSTRIPRAQSGPAFLPHHQGSELRRIRRSRVISFEYRLRSDRSLWKCIV